MSKRSSPAAAVAKKGGRPRGFDRDAALDAALDLFWRHGYDGVAISDLTAAIGIAAPSLYAAFGNKAALYRAALGRYQERLGSPGHLPDDGTAREAVATMLENAVQAVTRRGKPAGCLVSSGLLASSLAAEALAQEHRQLRALAREQLRVRIARGIAAGELPEDTDANALARFYATVLQGLSVQARDGATAGELTAVVARAVEAWPRPGAPRRHAFVSPVG